ncbi:MAG: hypothetical protein ONB44_20790 [candidate division KSB1 bacterium]|nr:hypothetical protein [candidate division KSB1 bacterium]MDZ7304570.1 hypothetical protein [candidate division KSB1 bacterium]MDZ7313635.1 hypothetical protein [candidate division KSB1 bacterium]
MKVKQIIVAAMLAASAFVQAQEFPLGIRAQALGGATVAKGNEAEILFDNSALLASVPGVTFTAFYSHPFGLKELRLGSFSSSANWRLLALGAAVVDFGNDLYRERRYHIAIARHFLPKQTLALGLSSALRHLRISGYGDDSAILFNLGTRLHLSEALTLGSAFTNVLDASIGRQKERLPRSVCFGFAYSPAASVTLQMDLYKQSNFPEEGRIGIEASPVSALLLRTGVATNPDRLTFGFALRLLKLSLQFAAFSHTDLGWTQQFAMTFILQ